MFGELSRLQDEVNGLILEIRKKLDVYDKKTSEERMILNDTLESEFVDLNSILDDARNIVLMWESDEKKNGTVYIDKSREEAEKLRQEFTSLRKKNEERDYLFNSGNLSSSDKHLLYTTKTHLDEGDDIINKFNKSTQLAKDTGINLLGILSDQRSKIEGYDDKLSLLEGEIDSGNAMVGRIECKEKQRKIFLYIIIAVLVISFLLFLYFIFVK